MLLSSICFLGTFQRSAYLLVDQTCMQATSRPPNKEWVRVRKGFGSIGMRFLRIGPFLLLSLVGLWALLLAIEFLIHDRAPQPAPLLEFLACPGFAEQQIQLAKGLVVAASLGAQLVLDKSGFWDLLDVDILLEGAMALSRALCRMPACESAIVSFMVEAMDDRQVVDFDNSSLESWRQWLQAQPHSVVRMGCKALLELPLDDGHWQHLWRLTESLVFNQDVREAVERAKKSMENYGQMASKRAESFGYQPMNGFNVVHLRAEKAWHDHCAASGGWCLCPGHVVRNLPKISGSLIQ